MRHKNQSRVWSPAMTSGLDKESAFPDLSPDSWTPRRSVGPLNQLSDNSALHSTSHTSEVLQNITDRVKCC